MVFKKKRRIRDLLFSAFIIFVFFGIPLWIFMVALILDSAALWVVLLLWVSVSYCISGRIEKWVM